ncbi:MAG: FG-GAP repeat protein [bacterium]|nr:MAG: FG-GAP repeat protein [bacterium]
MNLLKNVFNDFEFPHGLLCVQHGRHHHLMCIVLSFIIVSGLTGLALASVGEVLWHQKINDTEGGFTGILDDHDSFGYSVSALGDLDGDGVPDLAASSDRDDDGGADRGAVWILFLNSDGTVKSHQKISSTQGGFTGVIDNSDKFGNGLTALGDLDGDGVTDLAAGAWLDDDGGTNRGAVWILFLNSDGTVKSHQKISDTEGGFTGTLNDGDLFGFSIASIGDLDGDGIHDLAVGVYVDDDGGPNRGAVWILFLNSNGMVKAQQKISSTQGGFTGSLDDGDQFGEAVGALGDFDGDGIEDIAVMAAFDDDGVADAGAIWILFLNSDGTVKSHQKISATQGGFTGTLDSGDRFGYGQCSLGDFDCDGVTDMVAGAYRDDDGGMDRGAVWVLFLNNNGTVKSHQKISDTDGGFTGILDNFDNFGLRVATVGDLNGDNVSEIAVGARLDDDGGLNRGAVWVLFLDGEECPVATLLQSFHASLIDQDIQVTWTLAETRKDMEFFVFRSEATSMAFNEIINPEISNDGFTFYFRDEDCDAGTTYRYRVEVSDEVGRRILFETDHITTHAMPLILYQNHPNPFNPSTTIKYYLPKNCHVILNVYDVSGKKIICLVDREQVKGYHNVKWDGLDLKGNPVSSGIFLYRLTAGKETVSRKTILLR